MEPAGAGSDEANLAGIARRAAANDPAGAERIFARLTQRRAKLSVMADLCAGMAEQRRLREGARPGHAGGAPGGRGPDGRGGGQEQASGRPGRGEEACWPRRTTGSNR